MDRRCNTLDDLSDKARVPNIAKGINWKVFDMMKGTHKARTSIKHIPCDCRWKFYGEKWNKEEYQCQCKRPAKHHAFEKDYAQILAYEPRSVMKIAELIKTLKIATCVKILVIL